MDIRSTNIDGYSIDTEGTIYRDGKIVKPRKDGFTVVAGRVLKPMKLMYETFPELVPGIPIDGMDGYNVTKDGRVFTITQCKYMASIGRQRNGTGKTDYSVKLLNNKGVKKAYFIHRLVALAYIPNPLDKPEVNHIDGDPSNNNVSNLEWMTKVENTEHAQANYLYEGQQKEVAVRSNVGDTPVIYKSMQQASDVLGMKSKNANKNISEVCTKNASDKLNRGRNNKLHPFRSEGYIFTYV